MDKDCSDTDGDGVIDHAEDCAYAPGTEEQPCQHVHDEACGYAEADAGAPCQYECGICAVQELIDALPDADSIMADNAEDVAAQLTAIDEAKLALTDEEMEQLDLTLYIAAANTLLALDGEEDAGKPMPLNDGPAAKIGETNYDTLEAAWAATRSMAGDNPIVIELLRDCELSATLNHCGHNIANSTSKPIKLTSADGNKYTITRGANLSGNMINLYNNLSTAANLMLENVILDGGKESGYTGSAIIGCTSVAGSGAQIAAAIILNNGAVLQNNSSTSDGGGVALNVAGTSLVMNEGSVIQNNTSTKSGGGVMVNKADASFTMNGGTIRGNSSTGNYTYGGGVDVNNGTFTMNNGMISENSAYYGGGVGVSSNGTFITNDGSITGNAAKFASFGGGIYAAYTSAEKIQLLGGSITGNTVGTKNAAEDIAGSATSVISLGGSVEIGTIYLYYSSSFTSVTKLNLLSSLTRTAPISLKFSDTTIPDDTVVILKGENCSEELDPSRFTCSGMNKKQSLAVNDNGNLVLKVVTYSVSLYVVDSTYYSAIVEETKSSINPNGKFTTTLTFAGDYTGKYVFPQLPDDDSGELTVTSPWVSMSNTDDLKRPDGFTVTSDDEFETVTVTIPKVNANWSLRAIAIEKPAAPDAAVVKIDYKNETISYAEAYEVYEQASKTAETEIATGGSISNLIGDTDGTIYVRGKRTEDSVQSHWAAVTIPTRPAVPTGIQSENETVDGKSDGRITGVSASMEYKLFTDNAWTDCTGASITGLAAGTYQVRGKATERSFAGETATVVIGSGVEKTYSLNVTVPAFAVMTYGYEQPAAPSITITNAGNSDATVSSVTVDSESFTIGGSGGAVPAGGSISTWTIRPSAGLDAGTYTATITVTYNDNATATANVTFTVNAASQDAPSAPELESRTASSITLKKVGPNANGAAAQYGIYRDGAWIWQDTPTFTDLSTGTEYTFAVRYGETENYTASEASAAVTISTTRPSSSGTATPTYPPTVERPDEGGGKPAISPTNPRQGDKVTVTPKPDEGYEVDTVTVTDKNGKTIKVTDNGDGTYRFTQPAGKVTISVTYREIDTTCNGGINCPSRAFTDLSTTAWYHEAVDYVLNNGMMGGYPGGTFGPNDTLSRAMLSQILYNREGRPAVSGSSVFTDVADGAWYTDAIIWANRNGIVTGYPGNAFGPDDPITREQLAVMLYRYAQFKGMAAVTLAENLSQFTDADKISGYAVQAMNWAVHAGVIGGYEDKALGPQNDSTRAVAAQMLKNFFENIDE